MATFHWLGTVNQNLGNHLNYLGTPAGVPGSGDSLIIDGGDVGFTAYPTSNTGTPVTALTSLTVSSDGSEALNTIFAAVTISGDVSLTALGNDFTLGTVGGNAQIDTSNGGTITSLAGNLTGSANSGTITITNKTGTAKLIDAEGSIVDIVILGTLGTSASIIVGDSASNQFTVEAAANTASSVTVNTTSEGGDCKLTVLSGFHGTINSNKTSGACVVDLNTSTLPSDVTLVSQVNGVTAPETAHLDGTKLVLPGTSGNYASTPDSAALSITGDIDLRAKIAPADWTPAALMHIISKANVDGSYTLSLLTNGTLRLVWQTAAGGFPSAASTVATGFVDGTTHYVRVTLDVDNGAVGNDVEFYTSDDGTTWTQLGTTINTASVTDLKNTADQLEIGSQNSGAVSVFTGSIYHVQIRNNILDNGTGIVFDANFAAATAGAQTFTESSSNAATVTIHAVTGGTFSNFTQLRASGQQAKYATVTGGVEQSHVTGSTISGTYDGSFGFVPTAVTTDIVNQELSNFYLLTNFIKSGGTTTSETWSATVELDNDGPVYPTFASADLQLTSANTFLDLDIITVTAAGPDTTAPTFSSAAIPADGLTCVVTLTEASSVPVLPASGVTGFFLNGTHAAVIRGSVTGDKEITLVLSGAVLANETVTLLYTPGNVTDNVGNALALISTPQTVTNNSTATATSSATAAKIQQQQLVARSLR